MERNELYFDCLRTHFQKAMECLFHEYDVVFFRPNQKFSYVRHACMFVSDVHNGLYIIREWKLDEELYNSPRMRYCGASKAMCTRKDSPRIVTYHSFEAMIEDLWDADCDLNPERF